MAWTATDFAGRGCGRRYEKELETHFRDCMLFYLDGRIRFERYCYGEAACLVFSVWAHGFDADGNILWDREPEFESQKTAIPRVLTDIQEDGNALQFDGAFKRYVKTEEFDEARMPELARDSGIAPSSTPWGQRYLQKNGSPMPTSLTMSAGSSTTASSRMTYFK